MLSQLDESEIFNECEESSHNNAKEEKPQTCPDIVTDDTMMTDDIALS